MKKQYLFVLVALLSFLRLSSYAQIVGTNVFLQGRYVEIGEQGNGSFGTGSSPAGYHPHPYCCSTTWTSGSQLAEVYDYGHDGWSVGSPAFMGDYTYPGSPFEGWELQIGTGRSQAFQGSGTGYVSGGSGLTMTGSITGYTNAGGVATSMWTGAAGGLDILQETRVDTLGSAVVVTTKMYNHTASPIPDIYYLRSCDPDNDESWSGGAFTTTNTITHQNEDATHRVLVSTQGTLGAFTYMGLGTKDCRARCFVYSSWPLSSSVDLATCWTGTNSTILAYTLGSSYTSDVAIGLVYKLGTLGAGDSTVISYAYIFNGVNGLDSPGALPDPQLVVEGTVIPNTALPPSAVVNDTFDACAHVGMTAMSVGIANATDRDWSWSTWTWSPGTGLSATTGTSLTIVTTVLPPTITYTITGTDSASGFDFCNRRTMYLTIITCNNVLNNSPCYGDTLKLRRVGDSTGCTYFWYGPSGFTSTLQNPFKFPALYTDSGMYHVIRIRMGVRDTDSTRVLIRYKPDVTATSNAPLCAGMVDTLHLNVTPTIPGETFSWTGPNSFTSSIPSPSRTPFTAADSGVYTVYVTTGYGCKDTASTRSGLVPQPYAPIITGTTPYCQYETFVPLTVTFRDTGAVAWWYPGATGGVGTTVAPSINTSVPGVYQVWASEKVGSCEGPRSSYTVRVITRPSAPIVTGPMQYCQYIGPFVRDTVHTTGSGTVKWYTTATGGTGSPTQPVVDLTVAGPHNYWVSQTDTGCESARTPVVITVHPKPNAPSVRRDKYCQFQWADQVFATTVPASSGDILTWYVGSLTTTGTTLAPIPPTDSPGVRLFYVTATSAFGCVSNPTTDSVFIITKPQPPHTRDTSYCQFFNAPPLRVNVDSAPGSHLRWYMSSAFIAGSPVPPTDVPTYPTGTTWFVSQVVAGCGSDSTPINVKVIFLPDFTIDYRPWVCQFDSVNMAYHGPAMLDPRYTWSLPKGAHFVNGSRKTDSMVMVAFDSAIQNAYVYLTASTLGGRCATTDTVREKVVPQPYASSFSRQDVCLGDTVTLALASKSANAAIYTWLVDKLPMGSAGAMNIISSNSNSGGPFVISWVDSGHHIIQVNTQTVEGCKGEPSFDSVFVHAKPDATFKYATRKDQTLCIEDSVQFIATSTQYNYSYTWAPEHAFENVNTPNTWGRVELSKSIITLTVTDPYGCSASTSVEIHPQECCTVSFPSGFTPNGDTHNDVFRPIFAGFHNFHVFRVVNRWGQTVFQSTQNKAEWDGTYNGVPQDMGVYYYYLKYDCGGNTIETHGDVTLIR